MQPRSPRDPNWCSEGDRVIIGKNKYLTLCFNGETG
jgi:hypothetical protein